MINLQVSNGGYNVCCGTLDNYSPANNRLQNNRNFARKQVPYARPQKNKAFQNVTKLNRSSEPRYQREEPKIPDQNNSNVSDSDDISIIEILNDNEKVNNEAEQQQEFEEEDDEEEEDDDVIEIEPTTIETIDCDVEDSGDEELDEEEKISKTEDESRASASEPVIRPLLQPNTITLDTVWQGISTLQSSISNISSSMQGVSSRINSIDPRLHAMETSIKNVKNEAREFKNTQTEVEQLKRQIRQLKEELEEVKKRPTQTNITVGTIVAELKLREIKSHNLIIYDVPEDNLSISEDCSTPEDINKFNSIITARDISRAKQILGVIPNLDLSEIRTRRIGKFEPRACRPLMVMLPSNAEVIHIFKNRHLLNQKYPIKSDLTLEQRSKIKELRCKLDKMNGNASTPSMTIKYINGEPTIIPLKNFKFE